MGRLVTKGRRHQGSSVTTHATQIRAYRIGKMAPFGATEIVEPALSRT